MSNGRETDCSTSPSRGVPIPRMLEKPMWTISWSGVSVEPAMAATTSPRRMSSAASPTLWVPVEHAVTMHMFGPRMPVSIAIWPDAVSGSMLAMKNGLTDRAPFACHVSRASIMSLEPPPPDPKYTAMSSRLSSVTWRPEWARAFFAAATPRTTLRSVRRTSLKFIHAFGSKSGTSPATLQSYGSGSQSVIRLRPETPLTRLLQTVSTSSPMGLTRPMPVTAMRRV